MSGEPELLSWLVLEAIGRPLRAFFRWLDNQPHRDPSQISTLHRRAGWRWALASAFRFSRRWDG
jgi:hypothetical protein